MAEKKNRRTREGTPIRYRNDRPRSDFEQDDDEGEDDQRLDERETENHRRLNTSAGAGVARQAFASRRRNAALTESAQTSRDREADARTDIFQAAADCEVAGIGHRLCESRESAEERRRHDEERPSKSQFHSFFLNG